MILPRLPLRAVFFVAAAMMAAGAAHAAGAKRPPPPPPGPPPGSFEAVMANNPISAILKGQKLWTTPEEPQDWVKETRPAEMNFMPVGVTPGKRPVKVKTPEELATAKADLDDARDALDRRVGKPVAPRATPVPAGAHAQRRKKPPAAGTEPASAGPTQPASTEAAGAAD